MFNPSKKEKIMKKNYFLILILILSFSVNAQIIDDDFESYDLGQIGAANTTVWSVWSGTPSGPSAEDLTIVDNIVASGVRSGFVGPGAGPQDVMLLLGDLTTGTYTLSFNMFIPTGRTGYFNIQGLTNNGGAGNAGMGVFNSSNIVFNNTQSANGAPGLAGFYPNVTDADPTVSWSYPENEWFEISIFFDVGNTQYTISTNGVAIGAQPFDADAVLGAIDFFAIDANNEYYIDDVLFVEEVLSIDDFGNDFFSASPNPVKDILRFNSVTQLDTIKVFDITGKLLITKTPGTTPPFIDMTGLQSGMYLVTATAAGNTQTIKVIK